MFVESIIYQEFHYGDGIRYLGYKPKEIQTDNGVEFTYNRADIKKIHLVEEM